MKTIKSELWDLKLSRYLLDRQMLHPTEKYYPLRPELAESTFYLYQATKGFIFQKLPRSVYYDYFISC